MKCGWSNRPRKAAAAPTQTPPRDDISPIEIQKILAQATEEAVNNMKPRRKQGADGDSNTTDDGPAIDDLLNPGS
jgi:hypothetical protein